MIFTKLTGSMVLESASCFRRYSRFNIYACDPVASLIVPHDRSDTALDQLHQAVRLFPQVAAPDADLLCLCGWMGFIGYEAGLSSEHLRSTGSSDGDVPAVLFRLYDAVAIHDLVDDRWYAQAIDWPQPFAWPATGAPPGVTRHRPPAGGSAVARKRIEALRYHLRRAADEPTGPTAEDASAANETPRVAANMTRETYLRKVRQAKDHIAAGDIYQVNLTQRFAVPTAQSPAELYHKLRRRNPASHAAFVPWSSSGKACAAISSSPELFLRLDRDGRVTTRPIKGTRPRGRSTSEDQQLRTDLQTSEKDTAELAMIVDLLRNDLGRVCKPGGVRVTERAVVERHPNVFHRVATIVGDLADGQSWFDLLTAAFPGGSITGCPKIRAMQIIDELEPTARGPYCGAIGLIAQDGTMHLNIAIRTMVVCSGFVYVHAGGAIVADSDPDAEYAECLVKAGAMLDVLNVGGLADDEVVPALVLSSKIGEVSRRRATGRSRRGARHRPATERKSK